MSSAATSYRLCIALAIAVLLHALLFIWLKQPKTIYNPPPLQVQLQKSETLPLAPTSKEKPPTEPTKPATPHKKKNTTTTSSIDAKHPVAQAIVTNTIEKPSTLPTVANMKVANQAMDNVSADTSKAKTEASNIATTGTPKASGEPNSNQTAKISFSQHASVRQRVEPLYPEEARRQNKEGLVKVRVRVNKEGIITQSMIAFSSGNLMLDETIENAIKKWKFNPALNENGQAVEEELLIPYRFKLRKEDEND
ncbi:TonB family protein [Leeia sp. TBRC 13508]|uniref:TonB family protein n=1 Tax=Leeia speluncae TaxID=2884804 RepID=A0ABS8D410_9NEIS|nr:energy transducer TonB [Leeia speluncae]MCB6182743.1 TonB family protein [Leeia speluncae]